MHDLALQISGGRPGIRDNKVLLAAVERPKTYLAYEPECDLHTVCAVLLDSIARNHGFIEGNKRTGLLTALYTYKVNDFYLKFGLFTNKEFEELALWVVLEKPTIPKISKKLEALANKHKASGLDELAQKLKQVFVS
jgi:death-on-curing family protein